MKRRLLFCATAALASIHAAALTLVRLSDAQLVAHSERIVVGTVEDVRVAWEDPDGDGVPSIYTTATLRVDDVVKGPDLPGARVEVRLFGGTVGGVTHVAPGLPRLERDGRYVLCLAADAARRRHCPIVGATQGCWSVRTDEGGGERAKRDFAGASFVEADGQGGARAAEAPPDAEEPLADVLARLRAEVSR